MNVHEPQPPEADGGVGAPPVALEGVALEEWRRVGPQLETMGTLTLIDRHAFIAYCESWARYVEASKKCALTGEVVQTTNGNPIINPYRSVANRALQQCREFWAEFGMTASARTRISVRPQSSKTAADARKERFFGGGMNRHA